MKKALFRIGFGIFAGASFYIVMSILITALKWGGMIEVGVDNGDVQFSLIVLSVVASIATWWRFR